MRLKTAIKTLVGVAAAFGFAVFMLWVMSGFGNRQSRIKDVTSKGILLLSNGTEPEDLDLVGRCSAHVTSPRPDPLVTPPTKARQVDLALHVERDPLSNQESPLQARSNRVAPKRDAPFCVDDAMPRDLVGPPLTRS